MGIVLIILLIIILLAIGFKYWEYDEYANLVCGVLLSFATIAFVFCVCIIIIIHAGTDMQIQTNKIKYDSLKERAELITSEYEDVSKSDVIAEIADWNIDVQKQKYWGYNFWTSWFYNRKVVNSLEYIECELPRT